MKRKIRFALTMAVITAALGAAPASAEPAAADAPDEADTFPVEIEDDGRITTPYYSITTPACWEGHYTVKTVSNETGMWLELFYEDHRGNYSGHLFSILLTDKEDYRIIADYDLTGELENEAGDRYHIVAVYPTDVQFSRENRIDYTALSNDADLILDSIEPADGWSVLEFSEQKDYNTDTKP